MQLTKQQKIERYLPHSIPEEQICLNYIIYSYYGKYFKAGVLKLNNVYHILAKESDRQYLNPKLHVPRTNIIVDNGIQKKDIDFIIDLEGDFISFDAKGNGDYPYGGCCFESRISDNGLTLERWGYDNQADYIAQYMRKTGEVFIFHLDTVLNLLNNYIMPAWFIEESCLRIEEHDYSRKRNIYVKPAVLEKLLDAMENNTANLELPIPTWQYNGSMFLLKKGRSIA